MKKKLIEKYFKTTRAIKEALGKLGIDNKCSREIAEERLYNLSYKTLKSLIA